MSEPIAVNVERNFQVAVVPCVVTKQFDRCIVVKLGTIVMPPDEQYPQGRAVEVTGAFSRAGLESLRQDLESVPDPIGLPTQAEVNATTPYQWAVVMEDGEHYQQYPSGGGEMPFREIHLPEVTQFWIIPKESSNALPWYGLIRGDGWKVRGTDGVTRPLDLPHPDNEPFWYQYYHNTALTFALGPGGSDRLPPHIVQVLGWRIETTIFEIGVEYDGSWQVWKREPLDDPRWAGEG